MQGIAVKLGKRIIALGLVVFVGFVGGSCKEKPSELATQAFVYKTEESGITVRETEILTGSLEEPIIVVQLSDLHFSGINGQDLEENNQALMSTYKNRKWMKDGAAIRNGIKCLQYAAGFDQTVITGDVTDYLSYGSLDLVKKYIWEPYPTIMAAIGNHDVSRVCSGDVEDTTTLESRLEILQAHWNNNISYSSKVINDRVMLIQLDNGSAFGFREQQITSLKSDLALAREKGYAVLLFYHAPLCTKNPEEKKCLPTKAYDSKQFNFYDDGVGDETADNATIAVYDIIVNSADVIKGCFCGHLHSDYYTEIIARTPDGTKAVIPQYVISGTPYDNGHVLKITIR